MREILPQEFFIKGDKAIVEVLNPKVIDELKEVNKAKEIKVKTIALRANYILNTHVDSKDIKWFDHQIDEDQKSQI